MHSNCEVKTTIIHLHMKTAKKILKINVCPHEAKHRHKDEQHQLVTQILGPHVKHSYERSLKKEWNLQIYKPHPIAI